MRPLPKRSNRKRQELRVPGAFPGDSDILGSGEDLAADYTTSGYSDGSSLAHSRPLNLAVRARSQSHMVTTRRFNRQLAVAQDTIKGLEDEVHRLNLALAKAIDERSSMLQEYDVTMETLVRERQQREHDARTDALTIQQLRGDLDDRAREVSCLEGYQRQLIEQLDARAMEVECLRARFTEETGGLMSEIAILRHEAHSMHPASEEIRNNGLVTAHAFQQTVVENDLKDMCKGIREFSEQIKGMADRAQQLKGQWC
ncbi:hypothetical protein AAF712_013538 [Marasmius tenuissimus]|uniref:Uncharacterized protein n=1 Tax=Marasmius tenuissimus TaxID=585030 RepID=A0ABR2ZEL5_9AGAR